jgi:hypothetical protein
LQGISGPGTGIKPHAHTNLLTKLFSLSGLQDVVLYFLSKWLQIAGPPHHKERAKMTPEMLKLSTRLKELCELKTNWNGYGAGPVSTTAAFLALDIAELLDGIFPVGWQAVPGTDGDLQLEIHNKGMDLEIHLAVHKVEE